MMRRSFVSALAAAVLIGCMHERAAVPVPTPPRPTPGPIATDPRVRFGDAVARVERGDDSGARPIFVELLRIYPELEDYELAYLAGIDERADRLADGAALLDRLLQQHPDSVWVPDALARRARVAAALAEPDADDFVTRALAAPRADDRTRAAALLVRADLRAPVAPGEALMLYRQVRAATGASSSAAVARARSDALIAAQPGLLDDPQALLDEGTQLLREGRLDDAAARLDAAARTASDSDARATALRALARTAQRQGRIAEAIDAYSAAADVEPPPAVVARYDLATLLWNRDRDNEAATLFARIVREAPHDPKAGKAHYALGRIAEHAGRSADAIAEYRRVIASGGDTTLVREARWRIAWRAYEDGHLDAAAVAFAAVAAAGGADRAGAHYWEARTRERQKGAGAGADLYREVLTDAPESYYADLAEQRLLDSIPAPDPPQPIAGPAPDSLVAHAYHWTRSRELHAASLDGAAARELAAIADESLASDAEAYLLEAYREVEAHGRALRLASRLGSVQLPRATVSAYLYPRAYWPLVSDAADQARLDAYLVLALMRQESLFDPEAASPAAAYGLMQLILPTAAQVAGKPVTAAELADPARNVELGTRYLRQLLDRYDGNLPKALAAYNGGENAVAKWEARSPGSPDDEFVERISFRETRGYVKSVLGNYRRYRRLYGAPGERRAEPAAADAT